MTIRVDNLRPWNPRGKAQDSPERWLESSVGILEGAGTKGSKRRPFNYDKAVAEFQGWVYAAALRNAQAVASVPLRLYAKAGGSRKSLWRTRPVRGGRKRYLAGQGEHRPSRLVLQKLVEFGSDFEEVTEEHPVLEVLRRVNPFLNGFDMTVLRFVYLQLTGNSYLHPVLDSMAGVPVELWPMPAQWVKIIPDRDTFIRGYLYGNNSADEQTFAPDEVLHFKLPNPKNLYYGLGKVEAGWPAIMLNDANHEMDQALADNSARPDYVAIVKSGASQDDLTRFEAKIHSLLRGSRNAHRMIPLTGDVELKPLQFPPKDMVGREDVVEEIAAVFGVPVSLLKANDPNLASAKTGYADWWAGTVLPYCRSDEEFLNQSLLPLFDVGGEAVLAYDNPVPADQTQEVARNVQYVAAGIISPDEARIEIGEDPRGGAADQLPVERPPAPAFGSPFPSFGQRREESPPEPAQAKPTAATVTSTQDVQVAEEAVLNGAQIQAATAIVAAVAVGDLPRDSGIGQLVVLFNLTQEQAVQIMGTAGTGAVTNPNRNPAEEARVEAQAQATAQKPVPEPRKAAKITGMMPMGPSASECAALAAQVREGKLPGETAISIMRQTMGMTEEAAREIIEPCMGGGDMDDGDKPPETKPHREPGESYDDCVSRGIAMLMDEGHDHDQAVAMAMSMCKLAPTGAETSQRDMLAGKAHAGCHCAGKSRKTAVGRFLARMETKAAAQAGLPESPLEAMVRKLTEVFDAQKRSILAAGPSLTAEGVRDLLAATDANLKTAIDTAVKQALMAGGEYGLAAVGADLDMFNVTNPKVAEFLEQHVLRLVGDIQQTTLDAIKADIAAVAAEGGTGADLTTRIEESAGFGRARAETIARTESATAYVEGERAAWKESGVVKGVRWLLAPDACEFCRAAAAEFGDKVQSLDQPFYRRGSRLAGVDGGTMKLDYKDITGPPLHPNDRCDLEPVLMDEE